MNKKMQNLKINKNLTEFNRKNNLKQLKLILNNIFNFKKEGQTLYIFNAENTKIEDYLKNFLFFKGQKSIYVWTHGFITNFTEALKRYLPDIDNHLQGHIFSLKWPEVDTIFLTKVPEKNSSMLKELILLKYTLNIKIVAFVDINNKDETSLCTQNILEKNHSSFIDIPLYFSNDQIKNNEYLSKELLYLIMLKNFKK